MEEQDQEARHDPGRLDAPVERGLALTPAATAAPVRLGVITPSSNTNAEPVTYRMLAELPWVTAHFSRFALPAQLDATITAELLLPPAQLLAEAGIGALAFHGTSGSWKGVNADRRLCGALHAATGIEATTATLATLEAIAASGERDRLGLVFPGPRAIADAIAAEYAQLGLRFAAFSCQEELISNPQIAALTDAQIAELVERACPEGVDVVVAIGTNLRAAALAREIERRRDVTVIDSAAATLWQLLRMTGVAERPRGWGRLFDLA